ncbi:MAG: AAA family ATPase [Chloroflexota bacterium]
MTTVAETVDPPERNDLAPQRRLRIPVPSLVVLVGASGAGKSTFARRWFPDSSILSSDALRAELGRGEADQRVSRRAFEILHRDLAARLERRELTIVDATNIEPHARRALLARRPTPDRAGGEPTFEPIRAIAIVLDVAAAGVHARNAARPGRVVPADVVDRQLAALRQSATDEHLRAEGFDAIHRLIDPAAIDGVALAVTAGERLDVIHEPVLPAPLGQV